MPPLPIWAEWLKTTLLVGASAFAALKAIDVWRQGKFKADLARDYELHGKPSIVTRLEEVESTAQYAADQHLVWTEKFRDAEIRFDNLDRRVAHIDRRTGPRREDDQ